MDLDVCCIQTPRATLEIQKYLKWLILRQMDSDWKAYKRTNQAYFNLSSVRVTSLWQGTVCSSEIKPSATGYGRQHSAKITGFPKRPGSHWKPR